MSVPNKDYKLKTDEEGNEYCSLELSDNDETIDALLIIQNHSVKNFRK